MNDSSDLTKQWPYKIGAAPDFSFYRTSSGVRLCWELEEPDGPKRKHGLSAEQFPVSAYVGSSKNQKDLKGWSCYPEDHIKPPGAEATGM